MLPSFTSCIAQSARRTVGTGAKPVSAASQQLSARLLCMKDSRGARGFHGTPGKAFSKSPFSVPTLPTSERRSSAAQESTMSINPELEKAGLGSPPPVLDWADSTHEWGEPIETPPSAPPTTHRDGSSKATTPLIRDSHDTRLDSQDSLIPSSHNSPVSSTAASSKGDQPSTPIGTAVPDGSEKSRGFKRHGTRIFAELNENYPPSQSR
jgi:hypothetical protein